MACWIREGGRASSLRGALAPLSLCRAEALRGINPALPIQTEMVPVSVSRHAYFPWRAFASALSSLLSSPSPTLVEPFAASVRKRTSASCWASATVASSSISLLRLIPLVCAKVRKSGVLGLRNSNRQRTEFRQHQSRVQDAMPADSKAPRSARWPRGKRRSLRLLHPEQLSVSNSRRGVGDGSHVHSSVHCCKCGGRVAEVR